MIAEIIEQGSADLILRSAVFRYYGGKSRGPQNQVRAACYCALFPDLDLRLCPAFALKFLRPL
jgi:hypothetical protein